MHEDNARAGTLSSAPIPIIPVDTWLAHLLMLAEFGNNGVLCLERWEPVQHVYQCPHCGASISQVELRKKIRTVDCVRDDAGKWQSNIVWEHECAGVPQ
jgi:hypothetical protein